MTLCKRCRKRAADAHDEEVHNTGECGCPASAALCWQRYGGSCNSLYDTPVDRDCFEPARDDDTDGNGDTSRQGDER